MRIVRLQIDGFGALRDVRLDMSGPLTVVYGRNEAGKSTVMNFVRYVLFGFPPRGGGMRYEPAAGGAYGGALTLADGSGRLVRVERYERAGRGMSGTGVRVSLQDGTEGGEALLKTMLGGISAELYRSLFAFGLGELQELRTLQTDEVASFLYGAGFGADGAAIREAEKRLLQRMDELFRPRGRNQPIAVTVKAIDEIDAALRRSREELPRYEALRRESAALDEALAQLASRSAEARGRAERLALFVKARPTWLALRAIEREWAALPAFPAFPEAAVSRWETLAAEREALLAQRERLELRRSRVRERLEALAPAAADDAARAQLLALLERAPRREQAEREAQQLQGERRQLGQRLDALLRSLGADWQPERLRNTPVTVDGRETVRQFRERLAAGSQERARLQAELEQAAQREAEASDELRQAALELESWRRTTESSYPWGFEQDTAYAGMTEKETPEQLARAIRRDYEEWRRLDAEAAHLRDRAADERRHREQLLQRTKADDAAPMKRYALPVTVLLLGLVAAAWLVSLDRLAAAAAIFVVFAAVSGFLLRPARPQQRRRMQAADEPFDERLAALTDEARRLQRRLLVLVQRFTVPAETAASLEALEDERPPYRGAHASRGSANAWEQALVWLEQSLAEWEQLAAQWARDRDAWLRRRDRCAALQTGAERAAELRKQAERRLAALTERAAPEQAAWREWLAAMQLPAELSPEAVMELLQLVEHGQELLARLDELDARGQALAAELDSFDAAVRSRLVLETGESPNAAIRRWKREDEALQLQEAERERLKAEEEGLTAELAELAPPWSRLERREAELLAAAEAADEQQLRLHARLHERKLQLEQERVTAIAALEAWIGGDPLQRLNEVLEGREESVLERELQLLRDELSGLEQEDMTLRDKRGRIAGELEQLESSIEHADRMQRRQELCAQLERQAAEWTELAMAAALFRRTRLLYERDKQPFVLQRASELFDAMTEGRYTRIVAPIGEQRLLALRPDGETVDPGRLSRGTAEQLYLAMRLAIAVEYAKEAAPPLLLDDILVNFDRSRMIRTLELLEDTAKSHHVLLFTCHAHIVEEARAALPNLQVIDLK
ncbi:AAA family ATPase [Paenibacillus chartarius]|uniref:AAA family ATPase n=1 Tax=Paenibacillus chartarius TaxID=747481 RepID=A0ABV6DER7_9BACL